MDVLASKANYMGKGSSLLSLRTRKLMESVFGSNLLGYLLQQQNVGIRKLGFNAITAAVKKKELDIPGNENLLIVLVHIASLALRDLDNGIHECGVEMSKAVFCSPSRESVFSLEGVAMVDLRACVGACVRSICSRGAFEEEAGQKRARAAVVSLARQGYLGPTFIASVGRSVAAGYEEEAGELFCLETLVKEFGFTEDSCLDFDDVMDKAGRR